MRTKRTADPELAAPLWLEVIVVLDRVADYLDVSFLSVLRVYLVLVESATSCP